MCVLEAAKWILTRAKGSRKMADAKKSMTLVAAGAALEKIKAKYDKEMSELREKSLKNEQFCTEMANHCRNLAHAALASRQQMEHDLQKLIDSTKEPVPKGTPAKPPAKKATHARKERV
jgi:hypothetical protein